MREKAADGTGFIRITRGEPRSRYMRHLSHVFTHGLLAVLDELTQGIGLGSTSEEVEPPRHPPMPPAIETPRGPLLRPPRRNRPDGFP